MGASVRNKLTWKLEQDPISKATGFQPGWTIRNFTATQKYLLNFHPKREGDENSQTTSKSGVQGRRGGRLEFFTRNWETSKEGRGGSFKKIHNENEREEREKRTKKGRAEGKKNNHTKHRTHTHTHTHTHAQKKSSQRLQGLLGIAGGGCRSIDTAGNQ